MRSHARTLVISPFFDARLPSGGVLYSVQMARQWLHRGRIVDVICADGARSLADLQHFVDLGQLRLHPILPAERTRFSHHPDPALHRKTGELIRDLRPDVIHVHNIQGMMSAILAAVESPVPVILTALDFGLLCFNFCLYQGSADICDGPTSSARCARCLRRTIRGPAGWLGPVLPRSVTRRLWPRFVRLDQIKSAQELHGTMRTVLQSLDAIIALSPGLARRLQEYGAPADRVIHLSQGVAPEQRVRPLKTPSEVLRLAYLGGIDPIKGLHVIVAAADRLPDDLPLLIEVFGGDTARMFLDEQSARARRYLRHHPPMFGRALAEEHSRIDALLVPSVVHENAPSAVLISLANGTPVIASDRPGISHLIRPEENGRLIEAGSPAAWFEALLRAANSPNEIHRMRDGARYDRTTADFSDDVEHLESRLIGRPSSASLDEHCGRQAARMRKSLPSRPPARLSVSRMA